MVRKSLLYDRFNILSTERTLQFFSAKSLITFPRPLIAVFDTYNHTCVALFGFVLFGLI